jgi:copper(I)-binding protein
MAKASKSSIIAIILASLVVVASLVVLGCVVAHKMYGHHGMDHDMGHGAHEMHNDQASDDHMMLDETGEGVVIADIYARANGASAKTGAAFMVIKNFTDEDDRLIGASTDVAMKAELHTHTVDASGLTVMGPLEGGLAVPAHSAVAMKRGGHHVMMMGLKRPLNDGDVITLTLIFEKSGKITVEVPVDLKR